MPDTLRAELRTFLDRVMQATRVLPMLGFGRAAEPPTDVILREDAVEQLPPDGAWQEQQHVDVPSRAVGKRPRN